MQNSESLVKLETLIEECVPLLRRVGYGRCAICIGGSYAKGLADEHSDVDFRVFADGFEGYPQYWLSEQWKAFEKAVTSWEEKGINIDDCWLRQIGDVEAELDRWFEGKGEAKAMTWTIWGYQFLSDIENQFVLEDPNGIVSGWKKRLNEYPLRLQERILEKHLRSLNYWVEDYHYKNKVLRKDFPFTAGLASKLIHEMIQIVFALNQKFYPGDGNNLSYTKGFEIKPENFEERIKLCLYPRSESETLGFQYDQVTALAREVISIARREKEAKHNKRLYLK